MDNQRQEFRFIVLATAFVASGILLGVILGGCMGAYLAYMIVDRMDNIEDGARDQHLEKQKNDRSLIVNYIVKHQDYLKDQEKPIAGRPLNELVNLIFLRIAGV